MFRPGRLLAVVWLCLLGAGPAVAQAVEVPAVLGQLGDGGHLIPAEMPRDLIDQLASTNGLGCAEHGAFRYRQPQAATDAVNRWLAARGYRAETLGGGQRSTI